MQGSTPYLKCSASGVYYVHWTENRIGKRVSTRTRNLAEAQAFLGTWLLMEHSAPAMPGANVTLAEVWAVYYKKHVARKVAGVFNAELAWKQMEPFFGVQPVSFLSQTTVDEYVDRRVAGKLGRKVKPQTAAKELSYLLAAVRFCARDSVRLIDPALVRKIELPEPGAPRDRWLTGAEIQKMLHAAARLRRGARLSRGERFLWLALETGGRAQALLDLTWDRVDFETAVVHLDVPGRRKTNKGRAAVPISNALRPVLERAFAEKTGDLVLDNKARVWAAIQRTAIEAGLTNVKKPAPGQKPKSTGISPHVLRHTAATNMARRGVPLWIIAKILGNSLRMVEKVYAKHAPDDLRDAVNLISNGELEAAA